MTANEEIYLIFHIDFSYFHIPETAIQGSDANFV